LNLDFATLLCKLSKALSDKASGRANGGSQQSYPQKLGMTGQAISNQ
jgi:hypothetical protein